MQRAQSAIDFLTSYGIAILVIAVAIYVVLQLGVFNYKLAPDYCDPSPGIRCVSVAMQGNGTVILLISQSTGGALNLSGAACSALPNSAASGPKYGNVNVLPYATAPSYYPTNALGKGVELYPGQPLPLTVYCYGPGGRSTGKIGNPYSGFVWLNYTYSGLPDTTHSVQEALSFSTKFT